MDNLSVHQRSLKQAKAKKKPVRVVYISNPTRVKATASQFKGLVQELTGQYSDVADLAKFTDLEHAGEAAGDQGSSVTDDYLVTACRPGFGNEELHRRRHQQQKQQQQEHGASESVGPPFDVLGEVFTPQMLESLESFLPSSPYYKPSSPLVGNSRRLDIA